ncbi:MAG: hypothetical protein CBD74_01125 [Saprospirales bacterium TMED214]|nr:MAG: hypothetical protein CBD74_01125 [Saprospirales bacterium TMED214]
MKFLTTLLCIGLPVALVNNVSQAAERPNIILILIDGLGRDCISCYGAQQATSNIDRLANDGVRYETVWSMPACVPSRVTLLTGQYPFRHGWTEHHEVTKQGGLGLDWEKFTTVAKTLSDGGYLTAIGGHWQINDLGKQPNALQRHGFQESCVWDQSGEEEIRTGASTVGAQLLVNGQREKTDQGAERINSFLIDFTRRNRNQPFFIYYTMLLDGAPHGKATPNGKKLPSDQKNQHKSSVKRVDQLVQNLIDAVDTNGLREKTVIVLAGKNPSASNNRRGQAPEPPSNDSMPADEKMSDQRVHVPMIVRAVGISDGERVSHDLIDFSDIYPTCLELADLQAPDGVVLDGRSFVPSLRGSEDPYQKRNWIYSQLGKTRMLRDWQHVIDTHGSFHDLQKDPLQQKNVSPLDKIAPGRRQRLQMILDRFPEDAPHPR